MRALGATVRWMRVVQLSLATFCVAGCTLTPVPLTPEERELIGKDARQRLFADQEKAGEKLTLSDATARAIKYYADYRLRTLEEVLNAAQLDVARFDLLPRITASAGYTTRNNDSFGFGFSPNGSVATNPSASSERIRDTINLGLSWSVLDLGVSYFKAKQQADQTLIARERRHKAVQLVVQDVRRAWYRAEAAQRLLPEADKLLSDLENAMERTRLIESRKLLPPAQVVSLRRSMLELEQQISFRRQELTQANLELQALLNVPPGTSISLTSVPPESRKLLDITAEFDKLDAVALARRPEMAEEGYKARISEAEAKKGLLAVVPNLNLDLGLSYDSNRFLVNNTWSTAGLSVALNLVKVFSIPALNRSAEAQRQVDEARRLAMAMAILTQTRIAAVRYSLVAHEYGVWVEAAQDDAEMVKLMSASALSGFDSEIELIRARARLMISTINRDLSYANLQATIGQLYQSIGYDVVNDQAEEKLALDALSSTVDARLNDFDKEVFSEQNADPKTILVLAPLGGVDAGQAALIREGMDRVFATSHVKVEENPEAAYRAELSAALQPPRSGNQAAVVTIRMRTPGGEARPATEFKTTLSPPVDDEQLRVLGEGAAYRILLALPPGRVARLGSPRLKPTLELQHGPGPRTAQAAQGPAQAAGLVSAPAVPATGEPAAIASAGTVVQPLQANASPVAATPPVAQPAMMDAAQAQDLLMQMAATAIPGAATMPARGTGRDSPNLDGEPMDLSIERELSSVQRLSVSGAWLPDATALINTQIQNAGASGTGRQ